MGTVRARNDPNAFACKLEELFTKVGQPEQSAHYSRGEGCYPPPGLPPDLVPFPLARVVELVREVRAAQCQNGPLVFPKETKEPLEGSPEPRQCRCREPGVDPGTRGREPWFGVVAPPPCDVPACALHVHFHEPEALLDTGPRLVFQPVAQIAAPALELADLFREDPSHNQQAD